MADFYVKMEKKGGNDSHDGLSWNTAVATLQRALNLAMNNDSIIFDEGEFEGCYNRNEDNGYSWYAIVSPNKAKNITIKSKRPGKTIFKYLIDTTCKARDYPIVSESLSKNEFLDFTIIGIIFQITRTKGLPNYSCALVSDSVAQFYNCVFVQKGPYRQYSYIYFNKDCQLSAYNNCTFIDGIILSSYSGRYTLANNASNEQVASISEKILHQASFDPESFSIIHTKEDNRTYGVYSGAYKWLYNTNRYFFKDDEGYKNLTELVSTTFPTETQFLEKGIVESLDITEISPFNELVAYSMNNVTKSLVKFKPKEKTVLSSKDISMSGKELKKVSLIGTDNTRILFSKDNGVTWRNKIKPVKVSEIKTALDNNVTVMCTAEDGINYSGWRCFDGIKYGDSNCYQWQTWHNNNNYVDHHWVRYDFGENNPTVVSKIYIQAFVQNTGDIGNLKDYSVEGSNDGIKWIELGRGTMPEYKDQIQESILSFKNTTPYRYIRMNMLSNYIVGSTLYNITEIIFYGEVYTVYLSDISIHGLTPTQLAAITSDEWKSFMEDSSSLRFVYYLPDETANTDKLTLTVDFVWS